MKMGMEGEESKGMLAYEGWDEVNVSNEKGRREVHFYFKRSDRFGGFCSDLAVIGKEKSVRHMSYAVQSSFLLRTAAPSLPVRRPFPLTSALSLLPSRPLPLLFSPPGAALPPFSSTNSTHAPFASIATHATASGDTWPTNPLGIPPRGTTLSPHAASPSWAG